MPVEMTLEELRTDLAQVMRDLTETGPVRVTRHSKTVADIVPASLEDRRRQAKKTADLIQRLDAMDMTGILLDSPVGTLEEMQRLLDEWDALKASGVPLDDRPYIADGVQFSSVDEVLALMYFESEYPGNVDDPVAWFRACADVQRVAHSRGLPTDYPQIYEAEDDPMVVQLVRAGHTPDSFRTFGVHALDQGVALEQVLDLIGEEAIPADVLAHPNYDEYYFDQIREAGLPLVEATSLVRQRAISRDDITFVRAGIRSLEELSRMKREKINVSLLQRAVNGGLTFPELAEMLQVVGKYKYKRSGRLPFQVLHQAALENISLVQWDQSDVVEKMTEGYGKYYIDPSRILDMGRMGMSPAWVSAAGSLVSSFRVQDAEEQWDKIRLLHEAGASKELMNALRQLRSRLPLDIRSTLDPVFAVLSCGLRTRGQVKYLNDAFGFRLDEWEVHLRLADECQGGVNEFVRGIDQDVWQHVLDVYVHRAPMLARSETFLHETHKDILADDPLNVFQVGMVLEVSDRVLRSGYSVPAHIDRNRLAASLLGVKDSFRYFHEQHMGGARPKFWA